MKRILIIGIIVAVLGSLAAFAIPAFAHNPADEPADTPEQGTWDAMHEACEEDDWQAMVEAAEEVHEDFGYAPCHDEEYLDQEDDNPGGWGGMMGGHMGGRGGMMGW